MRKLKMYLHSMMHQVKFSIYIVYAFQVAETLDIDSLMDEFIIRNNIQSFLNICFKYLNKLNKNIYKNLLLEEFRYLLFYIIILCYDLNIEIL